MKKESNEYKYSYDPQGTPHTGPENFSGSWQKFLDQQLDLVGRMVDAGINEGMNRVDEALNNDALRQRINRKISERLNRLQKKYNFQPPTPEQAAADQRRKAARAAGKELLQAAAVKRFVGWLYSFFGASFGFACGVTSLMILTGAIAGELAMLPPFLVFTGLSGWMLYSGIARLKYFQFVQDLTALSAQDTVISTADFAAALQKPVEQVKDTLTKYTRKNWLNIWLDESRDTIYLDLASWQKARAETPQPAPEAEPQTEADGLGTLRDFVAAIHRQQAAITEDAQAVAELVQMEKTCTAILEWTEKHPESLPELRRLNQQYIPMTVKLLMTYNDLKLHDCDNADHVRQDIAGMLHALNQGFTALQDKMLEAVAMDVTGDIAALQGLLNLDGLSGDDFETDTKQ